MSLKIGVCCRLKIILSFVASLIVYVFIFTIYFFIFFAGELPFHLSALQCSLDPIDVRQGPPYICPRCGRKYNWRQSFHRHVNMECAQAKRYQCNLCSYCNTRKDSFLLHLRRKHKLTSRDLPDLCRDKST